MKLSFKSLIISFWILILFPTLVLAYYKDKEKSVGNSFRATTLDSYINNQSSDTLELERNGVVSITFNLKNIGELKTSNTQIITDISNSHLADVIEASVQIDGGSPIYTSMLSAFNMQDFLGQIHDDVNVIRYNFYISSVNYDLNPSSDINFKITNKSWQDGLSAGTGFTDNESIYLTLRNSTPLPLMTPLETFEPIDVLKELTNPIIE